MRAKLKINHVRQMNAGAAATPAAQVLTEKDTMGSFGVSVQPRSQHILVWTSTADGMNRGSREWSLPATLKTCALLRSGAQ